MLIKWGLTEHTSAHINQKVFLPLPTMIQNDSNPLFSYWAAR
jgi:hypothetical protein